MSNRPVKGVESTPEVTKKISKGKNPPLAPPHRGGLRLQLCFLDRPSEGWFVKTEVEAMQKKAHLQALTKHLPPLTVFWFLLLGLASGRFGALIVSILRKEHCGDKHAVNKKG